MYSLNTIYFLCATVGVFAIVNLLLKYAPVQLRRSALWRKTAAGLRYLAYRGFQLPALRYWSPSLGVLLLGLAGVVFFFGELLLLVPSFWLRGETLTSYSNEFGAKALLLARGARREEFREQSAHCEQDGMDGIGFSPFCFVCIAWNRAWEMLLT